MKKIIAAILAVLLLGLCACATQAPPAEPEVPAPETPEAPAEDSEPAEEPETMGILSLFSTTDLAGNAVDQTLLEGYELTMVNVWATYCGPCLDEMPDLGVLAAEYAPKGVQIVGLAIDVLDAEAQPDQGQLDLAAEIVASTGAAYPHIIPAPDLFGLINQISAVPTTFFVDEQGRQVGGTYVGAKSYDDWAAIIDEVLELTK